MYYYVPDYWRHENEQNQILDLMELTLWYGGQAINKCINKIHLCQVIISTVDMEWYV